MIERSSDYKYDDQGILRQTSKHSLPHVCSNTTKEHEPADFVARKNAFYQYCHNSDVVYNPTNKRNAVIFSTIPANLQIRKAHEEARAKLLQRKRMFLKNQ